jgi:L-rhamnose isomerase/sugar isomerase
MKDALDILKKKYTTSRMNEVIDRVANIPIEVPSWGFGRGGTRFATYETGKEPSTPIEKIKLAGKFHDITGQGASIALHFPWDGKNESDVRALVNPLKKAEIKAGSVNANLFSMREKSPLGASVRFGSLTNPDKSVRKASVKHCLECIDYMRILGSKVFVLWLPDGSNSPGQISMYDQADYLENTLKEIYKALKDNEIMLIEYKLFEPGFYSMAIQDYARSLYLTWILGDRAKVLVDLGHHAHGINVEQIIAHLVRQGKLGGFHFNDSYYADDDLATGSLHPHQLFRIFVNLVEGEYRGYIPVHDLALMIDQSHNVKNPFEELIESVDNILVTYVKSLLVDFAKLKKAQDASDPILADKILMDAFNTDVRPIISEARKMKGLPDDPLMAWRKLK